MWVKARQHAVDGFFDQALVVDILHIVALNAAKHLRKHTHFFNRQIEHGALPLGDCGKIKA